MTRETAFLAPGPSGGQPPALRPASATGAWDKQRRVEDKLPRHIRLLFIFLLFVIALSARLYQADEPPLDFHATRQYRSLIIARGLYFESLPSLPQWKLDIARINREKQGILEPPIMEYIVAVAYRAVGGEYFWVPRLISTIFWLMGGWLLYRVARRVLPARAALFSLVFFLFLPFSITASASFQPDPLMVMMLLFSILTIIRHHERPSTSRLMAAAAISSLACFIKPVSLFIVLGVFSSIAIHRQGIRRTVNTASLLFIAVVLLPTTAFYFYGMFIAGFLRDQAQASFLPQLLLHPWFWESWFNNARTVVGPIALATALLGTAILVRRDGLPRALIIGFWTGYVGFCLVFSYHIATHDYYHLQLIPVVALALGPVVVLIMRLIGQAHKGRSLHFAVWGVLALAMLFDMGGIRHLLNSPGPTKELIVAREVGAIVGHSTRTVFLSGSYGLPLQYHGELSGLSWPLKSDLEWEDLAGLAPLSARERFAGSYEAELPEYFIVLDFWELEEQPDLKAFLRDNFSVVRGDGYMVFDLRKPQAPVRID